MVTSASPAEHKPLTGTGTPTPAPSALKEADAQDFWDALMGIIGPQPSPKQWEIDRLLAAFMDFAVRGTGGKSMKEAIRNHLTRN